MKIFLSSLENGCTEKMDGKTTHFATFLIENNVEMLWNLMSFYYLKNQYDIACLIRDNSREILIDSGAHSFQKGKKVDWVNYTKQYADFIEKFDRENVLGYFEMDVDNVIGYEKVLELRKILESVSNKIIPVWHKNRGIDEFMKMCEDYQGKIIGITGFKNEDIKDEQYVSFLKYAKKYECKVHCLGMTRKKILDKVPFDFVDSSSWKQQAIYGRMNHKDKVVKVSKKFSKENRSILFLNNYKGGIEMQKHYYNKWKKVCKD